MGVASVTGGLEGEGSAASALCHGYAIAAGRGVQMMQGVGRFQVENGSDDGKKSSSWREVCSKPDGLPTQQRRIPVRVDIAYRAGATS